MISIDRRARLWTLAVMAALAAGAATAPALAADPCKSEDPLDFDEANRHADCGTIADEGWGTHDYDRQMQRVPDSQPGRTVVRPEPASYSHLPTTFSGWFDSLSPAEKRRFVDRLAQEVGAGARDLSAREVDAMMTLLAGEIDDFFTSEGLSADDRRKALAEIATEVGISTEPKRSYSADDAIFGDMGAEPSPDSGFDGWAPLDPTEDFGDLSGEEPRSDLDYTSDLDLF